MNAEPLGSAFEPWGTTLSAVPFALPVPTLDWTDGGPLEIEMKAAIQALPGVARVEVTRSQFLVHAIVGLRDMNIEDFGSVSSYELAMTGKYPELTFSFDILPVELCGTLPYAG